MIKRTALSPLSIILNTYNKMAFLSGPRQVGKTTLAKDLERKYEQHLYFNWDVITDQKKFLKNPYFFEEENRNLSAPFLVVLDEIYKYSRWKNYLKGAFDKYKLEKGKPVCLVECKFSDENLSPQLLYFQEKLSVPIAIQLVHKKGISKKLSNNGFSQLIISADQWLGALL